MSLANIYPYFRARMNGLGFTEWPDGFNLENIPKTIINKSYHILTPDLAGGPSNQNHQDTDTSVTISFFEKGFRDPTEAKERAMLDIETIVKDVCNISNRTDTLLNVVFDGGTIDPINASDDNQVLIQLNFTATVVLSLCENIT
jgi:hypothetical protein